MASNNDPQNGLWNPVPQPGSYGSAFVPLGSYQPIQNLIGDHVVAPGKEIDEGQPDVVVEQELDPNDPISKINALFQNQESNTAPATYVPEILDQFGQIAQSLSIYNEYIQNLVADHKLKLAHCKEACSEIVNAQKNKIMEIQNEFEVAKKEWAVEEKRLANVAETARSLHARCLYETDQGNKKFEQNIAILKDRIESSNKASNQQRDSLEGRLNTERLQNKQLLSELERYKVFFGQQSDNYAMFDNSIQLERAPSTSEILKTEEDQPSTSQKRKTEAKAQPAEKRSRQIRQ